jgi:hypothetical protein
MKRKHTILSLSVFLTILCLVTISSAQVLPPHAHAALVAMTLDQDTVPAIGGLVPGSQPKGDLVPSLDASDNPADPLYSTLTQRSPATQDLSACYGVPPTPFFTLVYGELTAGDRPAPLGAVVEVLTPRGEVAGCGVVRHEGHYGFLHVYGQDGGDPPVPGFRAGEPLAFRVNGVPASAKPRQTWANDLTPHQVDLAVDSVRFDLYLPLAVSGR